MSTLNTQETAALHDAMGVLSNVRIQGYDPQKAADGDPIECGKRDQLTEAYDAVRRVWNEKGHFS